MFIDFDESTFKVNENTKFGIRSLLINLKHLSYEEAECMISQFSKSKSLSRNLEILQVSATDLNQVEIKQLLSRYSFR